MKILMLGNSFTSANHLPQLLSKAVGAEVTAHTRGGARLSEQLNPETKLGGQTQAALSQEKWDYVILQEMSNGPVTAKNSFRKSVKLLCEQIRENGAVPVLYGTWAYQNGGARLKKLGMDYDEMYREMSASFQEVSEENDVLLADVGREFYKASKTGCIYAEDGVHPNFQGTRLAVQTIARVILNHCGECRNG